MILNCHNITKSFDGEPILYGASFHIEENEKVALVGVNGAGKTTLLRILTGELEADAGDVTLMRGVRFGYLAQNQDLTGDNTVYGELKEAKRPVIELEERIRDAEEQMKTLTGDALLKLTDEYTEMTRRFQEDGGYAWKSGIVGVAKGLGFTEADFEKTIATLSGGQRTRVALGKLLLTQPELIILDEPTNHLDISSIRWLETYLRTYRGAVLVVSHDRYFLNKIVTKVVEIEHTKATVYMGDYTAYAGKRAQIRAAQWRAYVKQQQEIKHQEDVIRKLKSFNREKSVRRAESREKMLDKTERLEKPAEVRDEMRITLTPAVTSGEDVLSVSHLSKSFGKQPLFKDISFEIKRGERVALIGDNGVGKTTLLKILTRLILPDEGEFRLGVKVRVGYYDQDMQVLHDKKTLFDEISDAYPNLNNTQIRSTLAAFLFIGDDVYKRVSDLSGGERGKLSLAKLMLSDANFLLLDEPTNHLDVTSKEVLESALNGYEGTVFFVSHDRYFINATATRILDMTDGILINYIGNYDYYMEHRPERMARLHAPYIEKKDRLKQTGENRNDRDAVQQALPGADGTDTPATSPAAATAPDAGNADPVGGADADDEAAKKASQEHFEKLRALANESVGKQDWQAQKELAAMKRRQASSLKKIEEMIESLEARNQEINEQFGLQEVSTNAKKLQWLADEQKEISEQLDALYEEWEKLS